MINTKIFVRRYPQIEGDFKLFLSYIWKFLGLPPPTKVQYEIADWMQHGPRRQGTEAFRGVGKSWEASTYCLWKERLDYLYKFLIVSASKQRAEDFSTFTQRLILEVPMLQDMKPTSDQRWSKVAFDVREAPPDHAPSIKSIGVFGMMTGSRANEIIADDIEIPNNSATQDLRDKLRKAVGEFESILKPGGKVKFLGTPQTEESLYNNLSDNFNYEFRMWPSQVPSTDKIPGFKGRLAPSILKMSEEPENEGKPTDPKRFNELDLEERKGSMGNSQYALQFLLDTNLSDAERYPLKTSDLIVMDLDIEKAPGFLKYGSSPDLQIKGLPNCGLTGDRWYRPLMIEKDIPWIPYEGSMMYIDPSGRGKDLTTIAVIKQLHGFLYLTSLKGYQGGYNDLTLIKISKEARDQKVNLVLIEPNFGDGMFTEILKPVMREYHQVAVEEDKWASSQKEMRIIDTLEPVMNRHRLVVHEGIIREDNKLFSDPCKDSIFHSLFYQMTRLTRDKGCLKHDDKIDVLSGGVRYWVESLARNENKALDDYKDKMKTHNLERFLKRAKKQYPNLDKRNKGRISTSIRMFA